MNTQIRFRHSFILFIIMTIIFSCGKSGKGTSCSSPNAEQAITPTDSIIKTCTELYAPQISSGDTTVLYIAMATDKIWKKKILKIRFLEGDASVQEKIKNTAKIWSNHANIKFDFGNYSDADIRIGFNSELGSWSYVGTDAVLIPSDQATMNFAWLTPTSSDAEYNRLVLHEFGHALGCIHEHQSPAANIPWDKYKVFNYYRQTQGWSEEETRRQVLDKYNSSFTQFTNFDATSIMQYPIDPKLTTNGFRVGWNTRLSVLDKDFISRFYPFPDSTISLSVGVLLQNQNINMAGKVNAYLFKPMQSGLYTIQTQGKMDSFMEFYEISPDNRSSYLMNKDDDSGEGFNALLSIYLNENTVYQVRVRHYQDSMIGNYNLLLTANATKNSISEPMASPLLAPNRSVEARLPETKLKSKIKK